MAYDLLGLSRDTEVVTYNEDARLFLEREPTDACDLVIGDAFNDFSLPYHLTTKEFNDRVRAWLEDDGFYVVNIIDGAWGISCYFNQIKAIYYSMMEAGNGARGSVQAGNAWQDITRNH